jgi:hypothetical protein
LEIDITWEDAVRDTESSVYGDKIQPYEIKALINIRSYAEKALGLYSTSKDDKAVQSLISDSLEKISLLAEKAKKTVGNG